MKGPYEIFLFVFFRKKYKMGNQKQKFTTIKITCTLSLSFSHASLSLSPALLCIRSYCRKQLTIVVFAIAGGTFWLIIMALQPWPSAKIYHSNITTIIFCFVLAHFSRPTYSYAPLLPFDLRQFDKKCQNINKKKRSMWWSA